MQQTTRKLKRKWRKIWRAFVDQTVFVMKIALSLVLLFFFILFLLIEPLDYFDISSTNDSYNITVKQTLTEDEFIDAILPRAKEVQATHGVRPSILIAQAALESDWGNSTLSQESNNYFGIKGANAEKQYRTREFASNEWTEIQASFKQYASMAESVKDYADLMLYGTSWDSDYYSKVLEANNYQEAAYSLQEAGYATDPNYGDKIIQIIEQHQLYEYDD